MIKNLDRITSIQSSNSYKVETDIQRAFANFKNNVFGAVEITTPSALKFLLTPSRPFCPFPIPIDSSFEFLSDESGQSIEIFDVGLSTPIQEQPKILTVGNVVGVASSVTYDFDFDCVVKGINVLLTLNSARSPEAVKCTLYDEGATKIKNWSCKFSGSTTAFGISMFPNLHEESTIYLHNNFSLSEFRVQKGWSLGFTSHTGAAANDTWVALLHLESL